jgi:hypothetical protein
MRNKPYVAALAVPAVLLLFWAISLWWRDYNMLSLLPGGLAAALLWWAYKVAHSQSFAPTKQANWDSSRPEGVDRWLANRSDEKEQPVAR